MIDVRGVAKRYRRGSETVTALQDVTLTIGRGELVAIVGTSGSGKTTLAHIIGGLTTPDDGRVVAHGIQLDNADDQVLSAYRNRHIGFVFQNFSLIPYYTALENVLLPMIVNDIPPRKRKTHARVLLERVGLKQRMHQRADTLSGGERQRVSIARALAMNPEIIIADEPTGSLDSARGKEIMDILELLSKKHHITVVVVTHDPLLAARASRIIELRDGRTVKGGAIART
jgi:ABC-type lipoprotein export system ATPase subunit